MVYYDDGTKKRRKSNKRNNWLLTFVVGFVLGAFLFAILLPNLIQHELLPYQIIMPNNQSRAINQQEQGGNEFPTPLASGMSVDISTQVTTIVEQVMPTVVGVENIQAYSSGFWEQGSFGAGTGSGVIYKIENDRAFVVTNHHVIEGADEVEVILFDGTRILAEIKGSDLFTDLAVLEMDAELVGGAIELGNSDIAKVGEPVIAIGNPLGLDLSGSVTQGIISGMQRSIPQDFSGDGRADWQSEVIQTDAAINPGNSGGALINMYGQLIGINSMKIAQSAVEGIGFAIPIASAIPVIDELEREGQMTRAFLGVEAYSLLDIPQTEWRRSLNLPSSVTGGIYLQSIEPRSPAEEAGLQAYDVIVELDGEEVETIVDLRKHLYEDKQPGDRMKIVFYRNGSLQEADVQLSTQ